MNNNIIKNPTATIEEDHTVEAATIKTIEATNTATYAPLEDAKIDPVYEYTVACGALNVRAEPSLTAKVVGRLYEDAYIKCTELSDGWGKIDSLDAWVKLEFLTEK